LKDKNSEIDDDFFTFSTEKVFKIFLSFLQETFQLFFYFALKSNIFILGKPKGLKNCTTVNQTFESLSIKCLAGESMVTDQKFILEVNKLS